jgi:hypothetical protein
MTLRPLEDAVLDGNSIGGLLIELFGTEMTNTVGTCGRCGTAGPVAEMAVYPPGLGTVVRCRVCDNVLMVFVKVRGVTCVDMRGLAQLAGALGRESLGGPLARAAALVGVVGVGDEHAHFLMRFSGEAWPGEADDDVFLLGAIRNVV